MLSFLSVYAVMPNILPWQRPDELNMGLVDDAPLGSFDVFKYFSNDSGRSTQRQYKATGT